MLNFFFGFGTIIYVSLLVTNAIAILSEERFLARGKFPFLLCFTLTIPAVGWSANASRNTNSGFGSAPHAFGNGYSQDGMQGDGPGIKDKLIHLITAVRTLMRSECLLQRCSVADHAVPLIGLNIVV